MESSTIWQVYPRVCGGTWANLSSAFLGGGLSPRVRGNPRAVARGSRFEGSIPACAGEPQEHQAADIPSEVYPRVCGGTPQGGVPGDRNYGLSPRVRGNLGGSAGVRAA